MDAAAIVTAYLIGSIPFALLLARRWGARDLHRIGSGNIGAANVLRASGVTAGVLVAILDISKGAAGVLVASRLTDTGNTAALAGFAAVVGHIYPVWLRMRGGKGVATACGVFSVLVPHAVVPTLLVFLGVVWATRFISLGSVIASMILPVVAWATGAAPAIIASACAAATLIVFRHRGNLMRVRLGTERRVGARA
jgi:glycerol-3-phosphate acyltransferase PlsY